MDSKNLINGEWVIPEEDTKDVYNPSNIGDKVGILHYSNSAHVKHAGEAAQLAFKDWSKRTGAQRADLLYKVSSQFEEHREELALLASTEMGKPMNEMLGEVTRAINILRFYAGEGMRECGDVIPASQKNVLQFSKRVPLGVVGVITPWNFPVAIPIWKIAPALICGNTIIWKPAEMASLTATRVTELFVEAGLPAGVLNLVIGKGSVIGNTLLEEVKLEAVSFTGSTETGQWIASACAKRNIKFQTEMGGKNAAVILADANLSNTIPAIISGAFSSAGQKCTATSRIIVEETIYEDVKRELNRAVSKLKVGEATDPAIYLGPVASRDQYEIVTKYADIAKRGNIIAEGICISDLNQGNFITPLVVDGFEIDHPLIQEEIFGPIAVLIRVKSFEEAIQVCNNTIYGLTASIFTSNLQKGLRFLDEADAGMVRVNLETAGVEYQAPFGGSKMSSSHTREQGTAALQFYTQVKTCAVNFE
ncbi:aldehyde dehydrogenase family protein [Pullulanibacillus sp. KACC 23026]|uniref:aldehyde dehydrogenase family protein n=1 Tax=Pullulanibacillus sp. KACC 23026 TaxID=3028315 RepID=UPI0023AE73AF|nr:aldehyde dehydrogenase family protein [Pullulanibacillus sp. KACC 23026]WEG11115.1 aldehyde dehydrogenase family protein [Pullulanibacillus sp. KACC 23026]